MRKLIVPVIAAMWACIFAAGAAVADDAALKAAISGAQRSPQNAARDSARHPYESLAFWGLKPHETVLEIGSGGGYWTEILANYAKATGGTYEMDAPDISDPNVPEQARKYRAKTEARYADETKFGKIKYVSWGPKTMLGPAGSVDLVLTARNIHDWMWTPGQLDNYLKQFYNVLKSGGTLAVEEHRADPRPQVQDARDGYVNTAFVIAEARKAGFEFDGVSEVNANPKDTKDHPFGVWTLPPTNAASFPKDLQTWPGRPPDASYQGTAKYQAIGESDRMTLRFKKPK